MGMTKKWMMMFLDNKPKKEDPELEAFLFGWEREENFKIDDFLVGQTEEVTTQYTKDTQSVEPF